MAPDAEGGCAKAALFCTCAGRGMALALAAVWLPFEGSLATEGYPSALFTAAGVEGAG